MSDGGLAFPRPMSEVTGDRLLSKWVDKHPAVGMSLRNYLAAHASDETARRWVVIMGENGMPVSYEEARYLYADAMLRARERGSYEQTDTPYDQ